MEHPQHSVSIGRSFGLGRYHVTRGEFAAFVRETGYSISGGCNLFASHKYLQDPEAGWQRPRVRSNGPRPSRLHQLAGCEGRHCLAERKLRGLTSTEGDGPYRLPSEAEWEYAARAGTRTERWWGDAIGLERPIAISAVADGTRGKRLRSTAFRPIHSGSPTCWVTPGNGRRCWNTSYDGAPVDGSSWTTGQCEFRVIRGGSWSTLPWILRSADRSRAPPGGNRSNSGGFRVAKTLP